MKILIKKIQVKNKIMNHLKKKLNKSICVQRKDAKQDNMKQMKKMRIYLKARLKNQYLRKKIVKVYKNC